MVHGYALGSFLEWAGRVRQVWNISPIELPYLPIKLKSNWINYLFGKYFKGYSCNIVADLVIKFTILQSNNDVGET